MINCIVKTFEEYRAIGDAKRDDGLYAWARQQYHHAIFAYEGDEDLPDIDFEFYLRLAECNTATGYLQQARDSYERAMFLVEGDEMMVALIFSERAKMWRRFRNDENALFDIRSAKKHLGNVDDPALSELKELLAGEIESQVQPVCESVYGLERPWPPSELALLPV